jgi:hypothetical protein
MTYEIAPSSQVFASSHTEVVAEVHPVLATRYRRQERYHQKLSSRGKKKAKHWKEQKMEYSYQISTEK